MTPSSTAPSNKDAGAGLPTLHLTRWTVQSGSNVQSRGAVVISSGDHQWPVLRSISSCATNSALPQLTVPPPSVVSRRSAPPAVSAT